MQDFFDLCQQIKIGTVLHITSNNSEYTLSGFGANRNNEAVLKYKISEANSKSITRTELMILWDTLSDKGEINFKEIEDNNVELFRSGGCYRSIFKGLVKMLKPEFSFVEKKKGRTVSFLIV